MGYADATLAGLANDGGLYFPATWPQVSADQMRAWRNLSYNDLATEVLSLFSGEDVPKAVLSKLTTAAYENFGHSAIAPLKQLDHGLYVMELFHGPTLAFKDFALQYLGQLYNHLLTERNQTCTIVGATSGDTGSAAIEAIRGLDAVSLYMLHPKGKVSEVQRRQMTTVLDQNIHNLAVDGTFDDCQNLVKAMFNDAAFRRKHQLSAVNSINWSRIAAQVVYYFRAALELGAPDRPINFSVPTGNFGNVLAGYVAKQMGLPINKLIIGSNSNDILTRFFESGTMQQLGVTSTLSPSMDIQISSNFERYLFELTGRDTDRVRQLMDTFATNGEFSIESAELETAKKLFAAHRMDDKETSEEIRRVYQSCGEIMDPHSVIGVAAAKKYAEPGVPTVVLGTAHPAKFSQAVADSCGKNVALPKRVQHIMTGDEHSMDTANDLAAVQSIING